MANEDFIYLTLEELYEEIQCGDTPETKPTKCMHWVAGWDSTTDKGKVKEK